MQTIRRILAHPAAATGVGAIIFFFVMLVVQKTSTGEWNIGLALFATVIYVALQAVLEFLRSTKP